MGSGLGRQWRQRRLPDAVHKPVTGLSKQLAQHGPQLPRFDRLVQQRRAELVQRASALIAAVCGDDHRRNGGGKMFAQVPDHLAPHNAVIQVKIRQDQFRRVPCLLYTSDAADE